MAKNVPKRGWSKSVLLAWEREPSRSNNKRITDISLKQYVTVEGKVHSRENPYLVNFFKARYGIYQEAVQGKLGKVGYANLVAKWYDDNKFVDDTGHFSVWVALRHYEDEWKNSHPDEEYGTPTRSYGSHHSNNPFSRKHEADLKKKWRQSEAGKKSTKESKERAKQKRFESR